MYERTNHDALERALAEQWEKENKPRPGINYGYGLLQDLFCTGHDFSATCVHEVSPSERYVAATAIQWLGTPCGFSFLVQCLEKAGYSICGSSPEKDRYRDPLLAEIDYANRLTCAVKIAAQSNFDYSEAH